MSNSYIGKAKKAKEVEIMKSKQSANSLFRFFGKYDYLLEAIKAKKLFPRYCAENFKCISDEFSQIAFPMICFCDINFSKLNNHITNYGSYGIAFHKNWGINKKIQPIQYVNEESYLFKDFKKLFIDSNIELEMNPIYFKDNFINRLTSMMLESLLFMKPLQGEMIKECKRELMNYHDEQEWRRLDIFINSL